MPGTPSHPFSSFRSDQQSAVSSQQSAVSSQQSAVSSQQSAVSFQLSAPEKTSLPKLIADR
jgi:hypothetical protein